MTNVVLPKLSQTGTNEWEDVEANDRALRDVINGELDNGNLKPAAGIVASKLAADAKPLTWYPPTIIATEQTRENVAFGTLGTPDEVKSVVMPEGGLMVVAYSANVKSSVAAAGRAAIFLNEVQLKADQGAEAPSVAETSFSNAFTHLLTHEGLGLSANTSPYSGDVTTGQTLSNVLSTNSGVCTLFAAAGTYNVSVRFRSTSGNITAKGRRLNVFVVGV